MIVAKCLIAGTYLVRDEMQPIPLGKTPADVSVVVNEYRFGWVCDADGYSEGSTRETCEHIKAAQKSRLSGINRAFKN